MAVEELTDENREALLGDADMAVVDFYAAWCGSCLLFAPKFARLSDEYPHVRFFLCDGERAPRFRATVAIENVPYFGLYRRGVLVGGFTATREAGFREALEQCFGKPAEA